MRSIDPAATEEVISYLKALISMPTAYPPGETREAAQYLNGIFQTMGYATSIIEEKPGLSNIVARIGSGKPSLVFNVHIDTVGPGDLSLWSRSPMEATVENGHVFGLGAANCKGSGAVQLWLAGEIAKRGGPASGEVVFTFVTDEESLGPSGTKFLRDQGIVKPDMLLLGAPTDNTLTTEERGVLWLEVKAKGKAAHAGQPEDGDNAICRMMRVLNVLEPEMTRRLAEKVDGDMRSTMNIGVIRGGHNTNVVPSECAVRIDRRLLPSEDIEQALSEIGTVVKEAGEPVGTVVIEKLLGTNGFKGRTDGPLVTALSTAIAETRETDSCFSSGIGVSDGRYFAEDDVEIANFGPGQGTDGHASNESVSIASLVESCAILEAAFSSLIGYAG